MSSGSSERIRTFAFGDLGTGIWGAAALWPGGTVATFASALAADDDDDCSVLVGDGLELRFSPVSAAAALAPADTGLDGVAQLCTIEGSVRRDGAEREVSCLGVRGALSLPKAPTASARAMSAWFGPEYAVAVTSLRPVKARGHDADLVAAAVLEEGGPAAVDEPRMSTTYDGAGIPSRAGLEIWLADIEVEGEEPRPQYPRRLAGEATGARAQVDIPGLALDAQLFRWHARGLEGAGVYALVGRR